MLDKEKKLTVGEVAKKLNVTVRTIQYYDQIGLVTPTEFTEGGRRLYSVRDYVKLHQILSLKEFGFSLKEIKEQLMPAGTVEEMNKYLIKQEALIEEEIKRNQVTYELLHKFRKEMNQLGKVDWEVFLEIIHLLRNQDEHYWIVKYLDKDLYEKIKERTVKEEGQHYIKRMKALCDQAKALQDQGILPDSEEGMAIAKQWWDEIMGFTKGDMKMIQQLTELTEKSREEKPTEFLQVFRSVEKYISKALAAYFEENAIELKEEK
ncbi:MerR family transcriptional regulator [Isachenkonia alkalipeptolytica]|uniref:MerR family transcriptional regulator n=1 Tax=Isachenkonia alkalipeptolytica TaxID=2565777 RepID=A0AA43XKA3_9CLOT|nr:MerR family transcriptional regulator [Isachenkonia alkalipeptolytica]NBG87774.1 MerR family transcriptional regulator [Isachenkonia alkalipeptolytica]